VSNIYSDPEDFGVRQIAQFDLSDGCYQFDYVVLWQSLTTPEAIYLGKDSGCSCPSPFEDIHGLDGVNELERIDPSNPEPAIRTAFDLDDAYSTHSAADLERAIAGMVARVRAATSTGEVRP
jgi:hypothetical protein